MINKLRRRFVFVTVLSVMSMILIMMVVLGLINYSSMNDRVSQLTSFIEYNDGKLPKPDRFNKPHSYSTEVPREAFFDTRYFVIYYNDKNEIAYTDLGNIYSILPQKASEYADVVMESNRSEGYYDNYKYKVSNISGQKAIIFVDATREISIFISFIINSLIVSIVALLLTTTIAYLFSPKAIRPIVAAYDKQKRFITDASHEIKTPLTIISANLDILELKQGGNKWIKSSSEQITRLTSLVNSLTALSRLEEQEELNKSEFNISDVFSSCAKGYEAVVKNANKSMDINIEEMVSYNGNKQLIEQLVYIIIDNAVKYCRDQGQIEVTLQKQMLKNNNSKINIVVRNTVTGIKAGRHDEFFDRFYKADTSRGEDGNSFGIGLSLAKQIVESHKGTITAHSDNQENMIIEVTI